MTFSLFCYTLQGTQKCATYTNSLRSFVVAVRFANNPKAERLFQLAMYHMHVNVISRAKGRSSIAAASYRSAERLIDHRQEMTFDFTRKQSVDYSQIMLPEQAPIEFENREILWNAVEMSETRYNSRTAREVEIALPREFDLQTNVSLVQDFVQHQFVDRGMCADFSIHNAYRENPHAHIMLTTREVDENGFTVKNRQWDKQEMLVEWRREWENEQNIALEREGHEMRVSSLTLEKQGIEREPSVHLGRDHKIERQHKIECERKHIEYEPITERGQQLERIRQRNELRLQIQRVREMGIKLQHELKHSMEGVNQKFEQFMERTREVRQQMQHKLDYQEKLKQTLTNQRGRGFDFKQEIKHTQEHVREPRIEQKQELKHDRNIEKEPIQQLEIKKERKLTIDPKYEQARNLEHEHKKENSIDREPEQEREIKKDNSIENIQAENHRLLEELKRQANMTDDDINLTIENLQEEKTLERDYDFEREFDFEEELTINYDYERTMGM